MDTMLFGRLVCLDGELNEVMLGMAIGFAVVDCCRMYLVQVVRSVLTSYIILSSGTGC